MREEIRRVLKTDVQTAILIEQCFLEANRLDRSTEIEIRKELVGIGRKNELLKFYFINKNGEIYVKFKNRLRADKLADVNKELLKQLIFDVNELFKDKYFKKGRGEARCFKVNQSRHDFISALANGIDPLSGQKLFEPTQRLTDSLNNIAIFLLRYEKIDSNVFRVTTNYDELEEMEKKIIESKRSKQNIGGRTGAVWTQEEDAKLIEEYKANVSLDQMAKIHGRTRSGIERHILKILPIEQIKK